MVRPSVLRPQLLAEALAAGGEAPEANAGIAGAGGAQQLQRRRRHEDVANLVPRHQPHGFAGIELARPVRDDGDAVVPGGHHHVEQPADPGPVRRRPEAVARFGEPVVRVLDAREVTEQGAVGVERALRLAGGAAGVDDQRRIFGAGVDDLESIGRLRSQSVQIEGAFRFSVDAEHRLQVGQRIV